MRLVEHVVQQGRLASAEEAGNNRHRYLVRLVRVPEQATGQAASRHRPFSSQLESLIRYECAMI